VETIRRLLRGTPPRYAVLAAVGGVVLYLAARATPWHPYYSNGNAEAYDFAQGLIALCWIGLLVAPMIAIRRPVVAAAVVLAPLALGVAAEHEWPFVIYAGTLLVAVIATWQSPRTAALIGLAALVPVATMVLDWSAMVVPYGAVIRPWSGDDGLVMLAAYVVVTAAVLGSAMWWRSFGRRDVERRELDRRAAAVADDAAVVAERARLARDLHDVVAHHVSLIAVRAETAPYTEPGLDESGRRVLAEVAAEARLALDELRGVLGILGRSGEAERAPQPALADVAALVERTRRSGQEVHLDGDLGARVPAAAGYAAYRVVQEALTNARKHAPGARVGVVVATTPQLVELCITNPVAEPPTGLGAGRGLAGMRERVEALGGRLSVRAAGTEFEVEAVIPTGDGP
jgi:signal transduction histidine kinase